MVSAQDEALIEASRTGVSVTLPEPAKDIAAQIRALRDPDHPKRAVFLCRGNRADREMTHGLYVAERDEGTLVTASLETAEMFLAADCITDADLAILLGYPEDKASVMASPDPEIVQAVDAQGCVIFEALASRANLGLTIAAAEAQKPSGGLVVVNTMLSVTRRRIQERG